jgi:hypothetical protein
MRCSAQEVLSHYGIHPQEVQFVEKETPSIQVVIATTGMFSQAMRDRMKQTHIFLVSGYTGGRASTLTLTTTDPWAKRSSS